MIAVEERFSNIEGLALYDAQRRIRRKGYDTDKILDHTLFAIEDLTFNCVFIRANELLIEIANSIKEDLPKELLGQMERSAKALEQLWDPYAKQYYSRDFITHRLIKESSIGALMPLYAGKLTKERVGQITKLLEDPKSFGLPFPVPSVPANSSWFKPRTYWQGPTWVNTNWLIIDGLKRNGLSDLADKLTKTTLELVEQNGFYEYFNPENGEPAGTNNFSWTAALSIDLKVNN
jgi:neutral trehalase